MGMTQEVQGAGTASIGAGAENTDKVAWTNRRNVHIPGQDIQRGAKRTHHINIGCPLFIHPVYDGHGEVLPEGPTQVS